MKKILFFAIAILSLSACGFNTDNKLSGSGATFPQPYYKIIFKDFTLATSNDVNYNGVGSGGGVRNLKDKTVDFGATDVFLSDDELKEMGSDIIHVPTALGAVVLSYNLDGIKDLRLTAAVVSDIYRGVITQWNDEKIKALNPDVNLPDLKIIPVYRSDGSGTTYVFSDYMSKADENWKNSVGTGKSLKFPAGVGISGKGNPGVAGLVAETKGSIGYLGSEFALAVNMPTALVQNSSGNFIEANSNSISAAANIDMPNDTRIMITNSSNPDAYPISTFTWIIVYKEQGYNNRSEAKAKVLVDLLNYIISDKAQEVAAKTHYAPLSKVAIEKTKVNINSITFDGRPVSAIKIGDDER
ncbi:phosphate ABC transporter substrate-binding protein PstS [Dysgonomonas sp. 520]|uniref:phosphate ABC transporter substrate-binding protein PstS n=1 Tax=Dysgonomonas sp. 520 TaxID=2302931 RepID=UPI0013D04B4D|nr:phosphate ABC transporter substrate-binding protein PstS [Dysgonomonas sp. 520]NDW10606.1 phosphate ABC transporter substrate-binding protein PstS [Dysgonomonas sp. 520]